MTIEGYFLTGRCMCLRTGKFKVTLSSEYKVTDEQNGYELFDTFFDPASKYSGPGTDGLSRHLMTTVPT